MMSEGLGSIGVVPIVGLPADDASEEEVRAAAAEIDEACRTVGFFAVTAHNVPNNIQVCRSVLILARKCGVKYSPVCSKHSARSMFTLMVHFI